MSPCLANIYLHYGLDQWVEDIVGRQIEGRLKYVRYADDFVCAFSSEVDAVRFYRFLPRRLRGIGLEVAEEKTRILRFGRYLGKKSQRLEFLGFELYWGKSRRGMANLKRKTSPTRMRRARKTMGEWIRSNRSMKLSDLTDLLNEKLHGHYQYYGVIGNSASLNSFFYHVCRLLFKWLNRRSQKKSMTWPEFTRRVRSRLINPRITEKRVLQRKLYGIQR